MIRATKIELFNAMILAKAQAMAWENAARARGSINSVVTGRCLRLSRRLLSEQYLSAPKKEKCRVK